MKAPSKSPPVIRSTGDFARYVGLSRSAVSRVLNNQTGLKRETIERVRKAVEETGFTVNAHARHVRGKPTATIGVCMEDLRTPTAVTKLSLIQEQLRTINFTTLIEVLKAGSSQQVVQHFLALRVEAIVFIGHFDPEELNRRIADLTRHGMPYLVVDQPTNRNAHTVTTDRVKAMFDVTTRLLDLGHRRFGLLGISGAFQTIEDRVQGVTKALAARGLAPATSLQSLDFLHQRADHFEYGRLLARAFVGAPERPTAFLAVNDETAIGALLEFQAAGMRIPADLSIVGFNNQNICLMTNPQLSSVDQQIEALTTQAVDTLLDQIGKPPPSKPIRRTVDAVMVERGSTGPLNAK